MILTSRMVSRFKFGSNQFPISLIPAQETALSMRPYLSKQNSNRSIRDWYSVTSVALNETRATDGDAESGKDAVTCSARAAPAFSSLSPKHTRAPLSAQSFTNASPMPWAPPSPLLSVDSTLPKRCSHLSIGRPSPRGVQGMPLGGIWTSWIGV